MNKYLEKLAMRKEVGKLLELGLAKGKISPHSVSTPQGLSAIKGELKKKTHASNKVIPPDIFFKNRAAMRNETMTLLNKKRNGNDIQRRVIRSEEELKKDFIDEMKARTGGHSNKQLYPGKFGSMRPGYDTKNPGFTIAGEQYAGVKGVDTRYKKKWT